MTAFEYPYESNAAHPQLIEPRYRPSANVAPRQAPIRISPTPADLTGPVFGHGSVMPGDADLTSRYAGAPVGERIVVSGRVLDEDGRGVPSALIEIWQANASGRYVHVLDDRPATLDPNFDGAGRVLTNEDGSYSFLSIKPGPYPVVEERRWWRPAHIHMSVFGLAFTSRLVTQMYFPGDPLQQYDDILQSIPDVAARERLISRLNLQDSVNGTLAYDFDVVLRGHRATPLDTH